MAAPALVGNGVFQTVEYHFLQRLALKKFKIFLSNIILHKHDIYQILLFLNI
jgi:hypothetical protein